MVYLKRLAVPWAMRKKESTYIAVPRGAHPQDMSIPLMVIMRDMLGFADTSKEAKKIIKARKVLVDGKVCRDPRRGIGLFDVIEIPDAKKSYRMTIMKKLHLIEIPSNESKIKLCRIIGKRHVRKGKIQLNLHDGRNIVVDNKEYSINDSLLIELPSQKIIDFIKFEPGCLIMTKKGSIVKVKNIERGLNKRILIEGDKEVLFKDFIVVGKNEPVIKVKE